MGSKALLIQCTNRLVNKSQQCKYLSSSSVLSNKLIDKALQVSEPKKKDTGDFFLSRDLAEHQKKMQGYITVEAEINGVGIVSGVPDEHIKTRTVTIYQPTKNAMQSGTHNIHNWQISFDTRERWENPLMGWCSSGDPLQALRVNFDSVDEAIKHCQSMGWHYIVQKPNKDDAKPRSYGANFSWNKRTRVTTK